MVRLYLSYILAGVLALGVAVHTAYADGDDGLSPVEQMLNSRKESKRLEGAKFRIAKPFLRRTPMGAIVDEIHMMIICSTEDDTPDMALKTAEALKSYILVKEIDDERSKMAVYVDKPQGESFKEIVIVNSRPEHSLILFSGDFTVQSLIKVGEISEQERKHLKKNK